MGSLFSSEKKKTSGTSSQSSSNNNVKRTDQEVTSKDRAVLDLKNSKDRLKKFKKKVRRNKLFIFSLITDINSNVARGGVRKAYRSS
jgi:hypothetical protein